MPVDASRKRQGQRFCLIWIYFTMLTKQQLYLWSIYIVAVSETRYCPGSCWLALLLLRDGLYLGEADKARWNSIQLKASTECNGEVVARFIGLNHSVKCRRRCSSAFVLIQVLGAVLINSEWRPSNRESTNLAGNFPLRRRKPSLLPPPPTHLINSKMLRQLKLM